ncbi:MAG: succinyldiaminopimelate transaminase, partial [Propionibacteriaceae bacterium]|nr:succinyldiaminopimelate transaminase [Propionibacteriaceae bacterium]
MLEKRVSTVLPDFPWDTLADATATARAHPDGIVDLSVGTPVDATPLIVRRALTQASDAPGYPSVWGAHDLHRAIIDYLRRRWGAGHITDRNVATAVGTKEVVGWLPSLLGLGADDLVVIPELAYPTYEVGAVMAGAKVQRCDHPAAVDGRPSLIWINSPANPHGAIIAPDVLRAWVDLARQTGAVLASDECYGEFGWDDNPRSVLDADINGGDFANLLAVFSASKRSNMAGYRAGFIAGDDDIVQELVAVRKHLGMMVSTPVQAG